MNMERYLAGSPPGRSGESLGYGQFYGVFECGYQTPHFALALISADEAAVKGLKHSHETAHLIFVLGGQYVVSTAGRDRTVPLRTLLYVPAGTTHQNHPQSAKTKVLAVSISESQLQQANDYVRLPVAESGFRHGDITFLASRLEAECRAWRRASALTATGLCFELLAAIAHRSEVKERQPPRWLQLARELLHDRCCGRVSISEVADAAGVHPIHLSRTFRKFLNCTPGDYLRNCRLDRAGSLLRGGRMSIAQVAFEAGFSDQSQFSKAFKQKLGVTPTEFRRRTCEKV